MNRRKICVVVASRANYGRVKYLLKGIEEHPGLELQLVVSASTLLFRFGKAVDVIKQDGFNPIRTLYYIVEGETLTTQAKSTGMGIIELSTAFEHLQPDMVVTVADRFETMATAISATYMNIPLVHLQGGELSGNIDDRVRHSITKLADVHFVSTAQSRERVIRMGENPDSVFNCGCPSIDVLANIDFRINKEIMSNYGGVGCSIDWEKPYILMLQHPVTTSYGNGFEQVSETLNALESFDNIQKIVLWPNIDAGTDDVSKGIRVFRERNRNDNFHYFRNFSPEHYGMVLGNALCCVGNSSSFIRENSFLGIPSVIVGDRQIKREHGKNAVFCDYDRRDIRKKILLQMDHGRYPAEYIFGDGVAGISIADRLSIVKVEVLKKNTY